MDWNNIAKSDEHGLHFFFATACDTLPTTTKNQLGQDLFAKSISSSWARDEHHHIDLAMKAEYFIHARQILDTLCESYHVDSNSDKLIRTSSPGGEFIRNRYSNKCSSLLTGTHHHWHSLRETPSFVNVTQTQTQADLTTFASWFRRVTLTQHPKNVNNISLSPAMITLFKHQTQTLACWHISHCLWLITATLRTTLLSPFAVH